MLSEEENLGKILIPEKRFEQLGQLSSAFA